MEREELEQHQPKFDLSITFSTDPVDDVEEFWDENEEDEFGSPVYLGPEVPDEISDSSLTVLGLANIFAGLTKEQAMLIDNIDIELS